MAEKGNLVSDALLRQITNLIKAWRNFKITGNGVEVRRTDDTFAVSINPKFPPSPAPYFRQYDLVKVTSAASGGGKYNGNLWLFPTTVGSASGTLAEADLGVAGGACLVFNAAEVGQSTHDLTTGTPVSKIFVGLYVGSASGTPIYAINGFDKENCT